MPSFTPDPIIRYIVRRPGHTAWDSTPNEAAAHKECDFANQTVAPGHEVYAEHRSGNVTGPYPDGEPAED